MPPDDPVQSLVFDQIDLTDADLPEEWPVNIREAFWSAVNAPTYGESKKWTLVFAGLLNEFHAALESGR